MNAPRKPLPLPPIFFVASMAASLLLAGGILGFFAPQVAPFLAERTIAVACLAAGVVLEAWAIFILIGVARQNQGRIGHRNG